MEKDVLATPEFFIPRRGLDVHPYIEARDKQGIHHVGRYQWGASVVAERQPRRILDIACGAGYGSQMYALASPGSEVIGVDYDERAVAYANSHYQSPNLTFRAGNLVTWKFEDGTDMGTFDAISSFDTIEHLLHREIALIQLAENMSDDGFLLFSTPCGHRETMLNPGWEHHKIEFSHVDLSNLMRRFFKTILTPDDGTLPNLEYWESVINANEPRYLNRFNPIICADPIKLR